MRHPKLLFTSLLLLTVLCSAQKAAVKDKAIAGIPVDKRPLGKYLVELCTLSAPATPGSQPVISCTGTLRPPASSSPTPAPDKKAAGEQSSNKTTTIQPVADKTGEASKPCPLLPPPPPPVSAPLDAASVVSLLGNPTPFMLSAQGPNTIAIYSTRAPLNPDERTILASFRDEISALAGRTATSLGLPPAAKAFTMELAIPHAAALGDLATRVNGLNHSQFTVQDVGTDKVLVKATSQPDCDTWTGFLTDIRHMVWQLIADPMSKKLFYLSSSDVVTGFSGPAPAAAPTATPSASPTPSPSASSPGSSSGNATITIAQPPGSNIQIDSDTTACVVAGLASGSANGCTSASTTPPASSGSTTPPGGAAAPAAPKGTLSMSSLAVATGTSEQSPADLLVFSDSNPGDDALVEERLRILAQLDLPRPEMIINAWVTQNSSTSAQAMGEFTNLVSRVVSQYNTQYEKVVLRGWASVQRQSLDKNYWHDAFRTYVDHRFIGQASPGAPADNPQAMSQAFLDASQATFAAPSANDDPIRGPWVCPIDRYCLGYVGLFDPPKPTLTDLLVAIIAARDPRKVFQVAIAEIEGSTGDDDSAIRFAYEEAKTIFGLQENFCDGNTPEARRRCHAIWNHLDLDHATPAPVPRTYRGDPLAPERTCADMDFRGALHSLMAARPYEPRIHLYCLREEVERLLKPSSDNKVYGAGRIRGAVADFLFNYKLSQHYPHEFTPYDLTRSADALNNALNPLIDAFNQDLSNYQIFVRADMQYQVEQLNSRNDERCCVKRLFGLDKPSFFNDGLVTVRTISGQATSVNTTSQSAMNVSMAPQLTALLNSVVSSSSGSTPPAAGKTPDIPAIPGPVGEISLLANLLQNYQTTSAQIGRALNLTATPRSLTTASSAEIQVNLNADESGAPTLYPATGSSTADSGLSRVSQHDTTTRVRIDSVKLFQVSSLTAILQRSRSRFPLLPPFVEIPYIGTFAGIPLGSAKEFHNSTAILSAYVVPTATDIAYGLRFVSDLVVDGLSQGSCSFYKGASGDKAPNVCLFRKALSLRDFDAGYGQLNNFNRAMVRCFEKDLPSDDCQKIGFDDVAHMFQK